MENSSKSGIFNVGTGISRSFNDVANIIINCHREKKANFKGTINYIPFPKKLIGAYQSFTKADIYKLREVGFNMEFHTLERGIKKYLKWLEK